MSHTRSILAGLALLFAATLAQAQAGSVLIESGKIRFYETKQIRVKAGLTPLEAIQAATIVPARIMKLDGEVGAIEVGKRADLIVLGANPLDNIGNTRKLRFVVTGMAV